MDGYYELYHVFHGEMSLTRINRSTWSVIYLTMMYQAPLMTTRPKRTPIYKNPILWIVISVVAILGACFSGGGNSSTDKIVPLATPKAVLQTPKYTPQATKTTPAAPVVTTAPTTPVATIPPEPPTMPDVLSKRLDIAEADLKDLGIDQIRANDETDRSRLVIDRTNWIVCTQEPLPGETVDTRVAVVLRTVKIGERCSAFSSEPGIAPTMPDVVSERVDIAVADLKDAGITNVRPKDVSSRSRLVIDYTNWIVCSQDTAPGEDVDTRVAVILRVVKFGERC